MTTIKKYLLSLFSVLLALSILPLAACSQASDQGQSSQESGQTSSQAASSAESSASSDAQDAAVHIDVTVAIDATDAQKAGADISALEDIAGPKEYQLTDGATAYDALVATGAQLDGTPSYVTSINGIAEGAAGKSSGWMYEVNGEAPMVAANECTLKEGDAVRWYYSSWE